MKKKYICFVAGKSGGHLLPCIAKAQQLMQENNDRAILFFTTQNILDKTILKNYPFIKKIIYLPLQPFPHQRFWLYPLFLFNVIRSFYVSLLTLHRYKPTIIISMGGLISLPVCIAGRLLSIAVELYELNVVPGKAIQALAPLARTIFICFMKTQEYFKTRSVQLTKYPLRFSEETKNIRKEDACNYLMLNPSLPTLFIFGGSQGSLLLNQTIKQWLEENNKESTIQIIHQTGRQDTLDWQKLYANFNIPALVFSFHQHIEYCYQAADVILCRAGAGTLFEILFFNKQSIVIPLETTRNNHQLHNALACAQEQPQLITVLRQQELMNNNNALLALLLQQKLTLTANQ